MTFRDLPIWRKPQHHHDLDTKSEHVHWAELFYDLIHVVSIFLLGNYLTNNLDLYGFVTFAGVFIALWFAWGELSIFNSIYVSTDVWHRLYMLMMISTVMFMAASIPAIESHGWTYFALGFAANRLIIALLYFRARKTDPDNSPLSQHQARNFSIFAGLFAISAFLPHPLSFWLFAAGIAATQAVYIIPATSVLHLDRFAPRMGHMSERFALLTLIVLGEGFFKLVVTLSEKGIYKVSGDVLVNFVIGGASMFLMCWLYFDTIGSTKPKDGKPSTLVIWWLAHLVLMLCAVMVGVALAAEVKIGFWEPYPLAYAALGCFGLAGYIAMLWTLRRVMDNDQARAVGQGYDQIIGISLAVLCFLVVLHAPSLVGNLIWGAALLSQILLPLGRTRMKGFNV
ncbi:low temperature requirement protein A [Roseibium sp. MB-4]